MGSSPSSPNSPTPPRNRTSIAPSTSRNSGFREIQLQQPKGAQSAGRSPAPNSHHQQSHSTGKRHQVHNRMDDDSNFSDLSMVAGQLQREQTKFEFCETDQPKYVSASLLPRRSYVYYELKKYNRLYTAVMLVLIF